MKLTSALVALAALAWLGCFASYASQNAVETGNVTGVIKGSDGKPAVGVTVRLERYDPLDSGRGKKSSGKKGGTTVVAKAVTDANGRFEIKNVPPGRYTLLVGNKKIGWIYQEVEVKAGEETKLDDLQLVEVK